MAVNFLEMNDYPEKYDYFKRFIDEEAYEALEHKHRSGKADEEKRIGHLREIQIQMQNTKKWIRENKEKRKTTTLAKEKQ